MNAERWTQARGLFDELIGLSKTQRACRLEKLTANDPALRAMLDALLDSHDRLTDTQDDPLAQEISRTVARLWPAAVPGQRFGAFRIVSEIGRGGMGIVYLAERCDGAVEQRVAMKILAQTHLDRDSVERLNRERQMLAELEHPNIARLIDAGESADGVPYFAMEYVNGMPITRYCDEHKLSLEQRLGLFCEICSAVQYAHTSLVVHGDLKPGNILVTASGQTKLLDFGIAVSLKRSAGDDSQLRSAGSTAQFFSANSAAPEQLRGAGSSIASDVYSLGVLLCELLGGRRPLDLLQCAPADVATVVAEQAPVLPSAAPTAAMSLRRGGLSPARLRRKLRGDLDAIAAKTLSKLPHQRYASVDALRADIDLHLARRPIAARSTETGYRAGRFLRRNALLIVFATVLISLLIGFLVFALAQNRRLGIERDLARHQQEQAQFERERAEQVTAFLIDLFRSADPSTTGGKDVSARQLLERGSRRLETGLTQQPLVRAAMLAAIADIHITLDELDDATRAANEAWLLREQARPVDTVAQAASLRQRARLANLRGRASDALGLIEQANALHMPTDPETLSLALSIKAKALEGEGKTRDAVSVWREALTAAKRGSGESDSRTLRVATNLSHALRALGENQQAAAILSQNLPIEPNDSSAETGEVAEAAFDLALHERNQGDLDQADRLARRAMTIYRKLYGDTSSQVALVSNTLGTIAQARGDYSTARTQFEQSLATKRAVFGADSPRVAGAEYNLGLLLLLRLGDPRAAEMHLRRAAEIASRSLPAEHPNLANYRLALGSAQRDLRQYRDATQTLSLALTTFKKIAAPQGVDVALTEGEIACADMALRPHDRIARARLREAVDVLGKAVPDDPQAARVFACHASD